MNLKSIVFACTCLSSFCCKLDNDKLIEDELTNERIIDSVNIEGNSYIKSANFLGKRVSDLGKYIESMRYDIDPTTGELKDRAGWVSWPTWVVGNSLYWLGNAFDWITDKLDSKESSSFLSVLGLFGQYSGLLPSVISKPINLFSYCIRFPLLWNAIYNFANDKSGIIKEYNDLLKKDTFVDSSVDSSYEKYVLYSIDKEIKYKDIPGGIKAYGENDIKEEKWRYDWRGRTTNIKYVKLSSILRYLQGKKNTNLWISLVGAGIYSSIAKAYSSSSFLYLLPVITNTFLVNKSLGFCKDSNMNYFSFPFFIIKALSGSYNTWANIFSNALSSLYEYWNIRALYLLWKTTINSDSFNNNSDKHTKDDNGKHSIFGMNTLYYTVNMLMTGSVPIISTISAFVSMELFVNVVFPFLCTIFRLLVIDTFVKYGNIMLECVSGCANGICDRVKKSWENMKLPILL